MNTDFIYTNRIRYAFMQLVILCQSLAVALLLSRRIDSSPIVVLCLWAISLFLLCAFYNKVSHFTRAALTKYRHLVYECAREDLLLLVTQSKLKKEELSSIDKDNVCSISLIDFLDGYIKITLERLRFSRKDIALVQECFILMANNDLTESPRKYTIPYSSKVSQSDLKHLAWNIGEVLGVSGYQRAHFIVTAFEEWFRNTSFETTVRTLHDTRNGKRIPLFADDEIEVIKLKYILPEKKKRY